jgi:hypothetical protein
MNPVTIQVVITGLCTLMNVDNKDTTFLPPAALIIPKADDDAKHGGIQHPHIPFIAWDADKVSSTLQRATTDTVMDPAGSATTYVYVTLEGDEIQIKDLPTDSGRPSLDLTKFTDIAKHSDYWRYVPTKKSYDSHYVPSGANNAGLPDDGYVAGYLRLGTDGSLETSHLTRQPWVFRDATTTNEIIRGRFAQEVNYNYPATLDANNRAVVEIILRDLANSSSYRSVKLTAKRANTDLKFFIGNGTEHGMYYLVTSKDVDADDECRATHFSAIHMMAHTPSTDEWPFPEPLQKGKNCQGARGDSTGYCGPDSKP